jgi:hypothetical protein
MGLPVTVEGSKSFNIIDPQCPHIKSSPPAPDIRRTVRRTDRFRVIILPSGIMLIVVIFPRLLKLSEGFLIGTSNENFLNKATSMLFCLLKSNSSPEEIE